MCERLVLLSQSTPERYVMCCEHGITHIVWELVTLRIPTVKLTKIAKELQESSQMAAQYRIASNYEVTVICNQHDQFQVWILGVGLYLAPSDFQQFIRLLQEAGEHQLVGAETEKQGESTTQVDRPFQVPPKLYSVN